jgi:hypothetical protein
MKIKDIADRQKENVIARADRAIAMFGADRELSGSQVDVALEMGRASLMQMSKRDITKRFVDPEDLIFLGLLESL